MFSDDPQKQAMMMLAAGLLSPVKRKGGAGFAEALSQGIQGGLLGFNQGSQNKRRNEMADMENKFKQAQLGRYEQEQNAQNYMGEGIKKFMQPGTPSVPFNDSLGDGTQGTIPGQSPSFDRQGFAGYLAQNPQTAPKALDFMPKPKDPRMGFAPNGQVVDLNDPSIAGKSYAAPEKKKYQPGDTRVIESGRTRITQEMQPDRTWKQISKSFMDKPEGPDKGPKGQFVESLGGYVYPPADGKGPQFVPVEGAQKKPGDKPLTESQAKAAVFLGQMKAATGALDGLAQGGFTGEGSQQGPLAMASSGMDAESLTGKAMGAVGNVLAGKEAQKYTQAQEQWAEAFLRFKTGAASTPSEVRRNIRTFFPQPGDSDEVLAQKVEMRQNAERDIAMAAGGASAQQQPMRMKPAGAPKKQEGWGIRRIE